MWGNLASSANMKKPSVIEYWIRDLSKTDYSSSIYFLALILVKILNLLQVPFFSLVKYAYLVGLLSGFSKVMKKTYPVCQAPGSYSVEIDSLLPFHPLQCKLWASRCILHIPWLTDLTEAIPTYRNNQILMLNNRCLSQSLGNTHSGVFLDNPWTPSSNLDVLVLSLISQSIYFSLIALLHRVVHYHHKSFVEYFHYLPQIMFICSLFPHIPTQIQTTIDLLFISKFAYSGHFIWKELYCQYTSAAYIFIVSSYFGDNFL